MTNPDILIPTMKEGPLSVVAAVGKYSPESRIIVSRLPGSCAANRNWCLERARSEIVIMVDDDIYGLYQGWDTDLIAVMDDDVACVGAGLVDLCGDLSPMMGKPNSLSQTDVEYVPGACMAIRNDGFRFDENYVGSGFEDTQFIDDLRRRLPNCRIVVNNKVLLVHANEQKKQLGKFWDVNRQYYMARKTLLEMHDKGI